MVFISPWRNYLKIYLAGKMRGVPNFNFPAFMEAAKVLRSSGHEVFNPAQRDVIKYGPSVGDSLTGDFKDIEHLGFSLREALAADTTYICQCADAVVLLPGWEQSKGAVAEKTLAEALGLEVFYY